MSYRQSDTETSGSIAETPLSTQEGLCSVDSVMKDRNLLKILAPQNERNIIYTSDFLPEISRGHNHHGHTKLQNI
jgi:hypothetical protein